MHEQLIHIQKCFVVKICIQTSLCNCHWYFQIQYRFFHPVFSSSLICSFFAYWNENVPLGLIVTWVIICHYYLPWFEKFSAITGRGNVCCHISTSFIKWIRFQTFPNWCKYGIPDEKYISDHTMVYKSKVKCRNTLDQNTATKNKYTGRPSTPTKMVARWSSRTVKRSLAKGCSNGCFLNWFTPSASFQVTHIDGLTSKPVMVSLDRVRDGLTNYIQKQCQPSPKLIKILSMTFKFNLTLKFQAHCPTKQ